MENSNRVNELCERAKNSVNKWRKEHFLPAVSFDMRYGIENSLTKTMLLLSIVLPDDYVSIVNQFPYYSLEDNFNFFSFEAYTDEAKAYISNDGTVVNDDIIIIDDNLYYRKQHNNIDKILILSAEIDVSFVLMFTQDSPEKPTPIVWCDYEDLYNYSETGKFKYKIDKWDSFTDFFEYLVEQEEKAQEDERNTSTLIQQPEPLAKKGFWSRLFGRK